MMHDTLIDIMTPLSRWKLTETEENRIKDLWVGHLISIVDKEAMRDFLSLVLSDTEFLMLAKRLIAFLLIEQGKSDVEVGKLLHLTRSTASRFRLIYLRSKTTSGQVNKMVNKLGSKKEVNEFLNGLMNYLKTAPFGRIPRKSIF